MPHSSNTSSARLYAVSVTIRGDDEASLSASSDDKGARSGGTLTDSVLDVPPRFTGLGGPTVPPVPLLVLAAKDVEPGPAHQPQKTCMRYRRVNNQLTQIRSRAANSWGMGATHPRGLLKSCCFLYLEVKSYLCFPNREPWLWKAWVRHTRVAERHEFVSREVHRFEKRWLGSQDEEASPRAHFQERSASRPPAQTAPCASLVCQAIL